MRENRSTRRSHGSRSERGDTESGSAGSVLSAGTGTWVACAMITSSACTRWASTGRSAGSLAIRSKTSRSSASGASGNSVRRCGGVSRRCLMSQLDGSLGLEGEATGEHLEEDDAEGVEVGRGPGVDRAAALGRHVLRRAEDLADVGEPRVLRAAGDAEVEELDPIAREDEHVLGLEVAVDDLEVVRAGEGARHLDADGERARDGQRPVGDDVGQAAPFEELHHQERRAVLGLALVEDLDHVGVRQALRVLGLADEALAQDRVLGEALVEDLDGAGPLHQLVLCLVDGRHPAHAQLPLDQVAPRQRGSDARILERDQRRALDEAVPALVGVRDLALRALLHRRGPPVL